MLERRNGILIAVSELDEAEEDEVVGPDDQSTKMEWVSDKKKEAPEKVTFQPYLTSLQFNYNAMTPLECK